VRRQALAVAARAVAARVNADHTDHVGPTRPCAPCGHVARYAGRRPKTFTSALGALTLTRAYYHCDACGAGVCPRDAALGLADTTLSPAVTRMVGRVGALVSFVEGQGLLHDLAGVDVDPKTVERTAEALGRAMAEDERTVVVPDTPSASTLYLGMDGTGLPMRTAEVAGRVGKHPDGSAKTREVKLVAIWSAEGRAPDGTPVRDAGSITYSAAIESAALDAAPGLAPFAARVDREAQRRGFAQAARRAVLGDGAAWIWRLADEGCPGAIQIVDLFHAKQHLSDVAKILYGAGTDLSAQWVRPRHEDLDAGRLRALCHALRPHVAAHPEARRCWEYVVHHRARMRYPAFRAQGLCVSSGVVEAGCKVAIGTRLKRAGMHWTVAGADAIIALRCGILSGRFEDFWERRAQRRVAA
jgi:hypothetical protein